MVICRLLRQHAVAHECEALLLRLQRSPLCLAERVDVPLRRRDLTVAQELLDCKDVTSPDVHLSGSRGPEVV